MPAPQAGDDELHLERFLPYRLSLLANTVSAAIADAYSTRHDMTIPEWRVMAVLAHAPGLSAAEVADRTGMDKVAVSRAVARLLRRRRLRRRQTATDRRRSQLELSAEGSEVYSRIAPWALHYERELVKALTPEELRLLDGALTRLLDRARAIPAGDGP
jgi:DNA-binding MarR family transcriptional regulator